MDDVLVFGGKEYVSSRRAAEMTGYTKDYVGQLCRGGKLDAKLIGRNWYISIAALPEHKTEHKIQQKNQEAKQAAPSAFHRHLIGHHQKHKQHDEHEHVAAKSETVQEKPPAIKASTIPVAHKIKQNRTQNNILTQMDVVYEKGAPVFYPDDRPLNPTIHKSQEDKPVAEKSPIQIATRPVPSPIGINTVMKRPTPSFAQRPSRHVISAVTMHRGGNTRFSDVRTQTTAAVRQAPRAISHHNMVSRVSEMSQNDMQNKVEKMVGKVGKKRSHHKKTSTLGATLILLGLALLSGLFVFSVGQDVVQSTASVGNMQIR